MTKGYNITVPEICEMCPAEMQPYIDAHNIELDERDGYVYAATFRYGVNMLQYTLDHILNGNKARSEIDKETIRQTMKEQEEANKPLTQEEIIAETKAYFRQRKIDKLNFDLAKLQEEKRKSKG